MTLATIALVLTTTLSSTTPAEHRIAWAEAKLANAPESADALNDLAFALTRRAREIAQHDLYDRADAIVERSLAVAPDNFRGHKLRAWIRLGQHRFADALDIATELHQRRPDDLQVAGFLVDANVELGRYDEAEHAAQWMLDLRPGSVAGLARAAFLHELWGDLDGALELMHAAHIRTPFHEREDRAWLLTHVARLERMRGRLERADATLADALDAFPEYHYTLRELAALRAQQGRPLEHLEFTRRHYRAAPHPENRFLLGEALLRAGHDDEARREFERFERDARMEMAGDDNANHELVYYLTDHAGRIDEAVRLAERELGRRGDVYTRAAFAWSLHCAGQSERARAELDRVLAIGVRDPELLERAAIVSASR